MDWTDTLTQEERSSNLKQTEVIQECSWATVGPHLEQGNTTHLESHARHWEVSHSHLNALRVKELELFSQPI